jgi:ABC-type bacteriocin/lantibiotic exporter with double-glycine peptidase domain
MRVIKDFPIKKQWHNYDCGAMVLWCVALFYGKKISYNKVLTWLKTSPFHGTSVKRFFKVCKKLDIKCDRFRNDIPRIKKHIRKGNPVVCLIQNECNGTWYSTWEHGHYVVVIGYASKSLFYFDPFTGCVVKIKIKEFKKRWHDMAKGVVYKKIAIALF